MDVKTKFLNDTIEDEAYLELPRGFVTHNVESHVFPHRILNKALYGLKKPPKS